LLHLGRVERDDLIVQMADFCLQFEGVEWVVVSGKLDGNLVIAVRNHGTGRRNAGELVRKLFGEMGSAGGHRNMSKAVIALNDWRAREHTLRDSAIETRLWELFEAQISGDNDADD
jgi:nanoRNase/pAp phosphatase (c-di-AMP/oligoRNAs hydrolase)